MPIHRQFAPDPASAAQSCRLWSAHVDALDRHLATDKWALTGVTVLLLAYPFARIVMPTVLHGIVPDVVRTVFHLI